MFKTAIVRTPCENMVHGLTESREGPPDHDLALEQHGNYVSALKKCGVEVVVLPAANDFPDSCFVEDVAVCTRNHAMITRPGAESRRGETLLIRKVLEHLCKEIEEIRAPATLDGGDVMMVGDHFYIGLSARTSVEGATQFVERLACHGMGGSALQIDGMLHLKTGMAYLENNHLLVVPAVADRPEFAQFNRILVPEEEQYAANSIWINGTVIMPAGYPQTEASVRGAGYTVVTVDTSEFRKLDGGVSCLSLRF